MIVVRVELHSAITGHTTELARMITANDGEGTREVGHYVATTLRGRSREALDQMQVQRSGRIRNWPRLRLHVWNLVAEALKGVGYGHRIPEQPQLPETADVRLPTEAQHG
jgi:hypothetical protein